MRHRNRITVTAVLLSAVACASAQSFVYSNLTSADVGLVGLSGAGLLTVGGGPIGPAGTNSLIDFFPTSLAVGDGTGISNKALLFDYNVLASAQMGGIGVVLSGTLGGAGRVTFTEIVFDPSNVQIANFSNSFTIAGTTNVRGSFQLVGNTYTYTDNQAFTLPQTAYRVEKRMSVSVPDNFVPAKDFASIGLIEQNQQPVPEPATMLGLAIGAIGIFARRRRK